MEIEASRAKKQHRDIIVDLQSLPPRGGHVLITLDSLDDLVRVADALIKPVLHVAEADKHRYFINDGLTLYEYVSLEHPELRGKD